MPDSGAPKPPPSWPWAWPLLSQRMVTPVARCQPLSNSAVPTGTSRGTARTLSMGTLKTEVM